VEAIRINSSAGGAAPLTGPQVISSALGPSNATPETQPATAPQGTPTPTKRPVAKKTGGQ
jgi:hypothetical protein